MELFTSLFLVCSFLILVVSSLNNVNADFIRVGVIGDYGRATVPPEYRRWYNHTGEASVADMIKHQYPFRLNNKDLDFIITLGDNNYVLGNWSTVDANIGQFYADWIYPYNGNYTRSASAPNYNRFWPVLGNHAYYVNEETYLSRDCLTCPAPYLKYFAGVLPPAGSTAPASANGRYYDFVRGNVHFFALNSNVQEPDGRNETGKQAMWLKEALAKSTSNHKIVYLHHLCYSNDNHDGPNPDLCWPFQEWGASLVIAGHAHAYQKFFVDDFYWVNNGLGGSFMYASIPPTDFSPGTQVWYNSSWSAQLLEADECSLNLTFVSLDRTYYDTVRLPPVVQPAGGCSYINGGGRSNNNNNGGGSSSSLGKNHDLDIGIGIGVGVTLGAFLVGYFIMSLVQKKKNAHSVLGGSGGGGNSAVREYEHVS